MDPGLTGRHAVYRAALHRRGPFWVVGQSGGAGTGWSPTRSVPWAWSAVFVPSA